MLKEYSVIEKLLSYLEETNLSDANELYVEIVRLIAKSYVQKPILSLQTTLLMGGRKFG